MAEHRPTLGSRLRAVRPWSSNQIECVCGQEWTPQHEAESAGGRPWRAGDGPIPDSPGQQRLPLDFIQTRDGVHQIDKHGNDGGRW